MPPSGLVESCREVVVGVVVDTTGVLTTLDVVDGIVGATLLVVDRVEEEDGILLDVEVVLIGELVGVVVETGLWVRRDTWLS